ncbi:Endonuclease/exonuclease/phosphatase [Roridomyces roridus]|uniref:Endonuclease/exonuclease/phosphatase n=1 Tax=Roridomyces roridus TaxID=1738132 RepID=A0AAD7FPI2_9AGAR|nr:Endonuclease/exonuclease/phosphatase [Roridomyces roridus]
MSKNFHRTPEQIALAEERKAKRQKLLHEQPPPSVDNASLFLSRPWLDLDPRQGSRVMTWNLLAQCLVRRELFPTSDCLKGHQRLPMLHAELLAQAPDIMCLQEVDHLDKLLPVLEKAGYGHHYAAGPGKKHWLLNRIQEYRICENVRSEGGLRGSSFRTRNIASLLALKNLSQDKQGVLIGTTHLFWHPRQAGILIREILRFRSEIEREDWPCIIAGDFNFSPDDPAYSLLVGEQLNAEQRERLDFSRVVHVSIDPSVPPTTAAPLADDESEAVDPDRVITNARRAVPADGLLSDDELVSLFASGAVVRSAYDEGRRLSTADPDIPTFGKRMSIQPTTKGFYEPEYTSYTHYWKTVLDYIFILTDRNAVVTGLLAPHVTKNIELGLPQKGVCGSDHMSLCAEIRFEASNATTC